MRLRETLNVLKVLVLLIIIFLPAVPWLWNFKSVFLILKILQYARLRWWVQLFPRYPCNNWYKNWYFHFYKISDHQIWQAGISIRSDWNETNCRWPVDVTSLRRDHVPNQKHISTTRVSMATKFGRMLTDLDGLLPIKSHKPLITQSFKITWQI